MFAGSDIKCVQPPRQDQRKFFERNILVQSERPRARRYPFVTNIEITDVDSETQTNEQTCDLNGACEWAWFSARLSLISNWF